MKKQGLALLILFGCICFPDSQGVGQTITSDPGYIVEQWSVEDGLPVNNVVDIIQSKNGYLWFVTFDGLVRFDGVRFKVFQKETYPGMESNRLAQIFEADDNVLWLITEQNYLLKYEDGNFERIDSKVGLASDYVLDIIQNKQGELLIGTTQGITKYIDGEYTPYKPALINQEVNHIFESWNNDIWFTNKQRTMLYRVHNDSLEHVPVSAGSAQTSQLSEHNQTVWFGANGNVYWQDETGLHEHSSINVGVRGIVDIGFDQFGQLWGYGPLGGIYSYSDGRWNHLEGSGDSKYLIFDNTFTVDGDNFWITTTNGVWENGKQILSVPDGIYTNWLDREGNMWIGTTSNGLIRVRKNPFTTISVKEGLPYKNVYSVAEGDSGVIFVGTYGGGVAKITGDEIIQTLRVGTSSTGGVMLGMEKGKDGTMYVSSLGTSVLVIKPGDKVIEQSPFSKEDKYENIRAIFQDVDDTLWMGGRSGLFKYSHGTFYDVGEGDQFEKGKIRFFKKGPDSTLWMASDGNGFVGYKSGKVKEYGLDEGFPSNLIRSLFIEDGSNPADYVLWVGTQDVGLLRVEVKNGEPVSETVTKYGTSNGMLDYVIHIILDDDSQNFWMNTNRGIFRVSKEELEAFHHGETDMISGVSYSEKDGLRNREGNGGVQPAGIQATDGTMWLANQDGVISFDPNVLTGNAGSLPPNVVIEEVDVDGNTLFPENGGVQLEKEQRDFEIHFTVLSLVSSTNNKLKYRLVGFNNEWQNAGDRRSAVYTNIPAGNYTLEVMGANNNGFWNPEPAVLTISVAPFFYETDWFKVLTILFLGVAFFGGIQWRVKALKVREQKLERLVVERTSELKKEKELTEEQAVRLKELDQTKTRFFTNISHELRTPLTLIMSPLQKLISEDEKFDKSTQRQFQRMLLNSERLLRLIDQTLELTRLEQGKTKIKVREIEVVSFLSVLIDLFKGVADNKSISINFEKEHVETRAYVDPDKLDKIVANLLSNAIKFTRPGGAIRLVLDESEEEISISVIDSGIGIASLEQERIFDRFYQVDSSETRNHEGSGIGLSLARDFARLHHGDLTVSSEKGIGSMFTLTLKKGKDHFRESDFAEVQHSISPEYHETIETEESAENNQIELISSNKTVLIVEDNAGLREFIHDLLEDTYNIIEAENGAIGLEKAREALPDLVIADIMMPEMDGLSFNKELKEDLETASIPVIFLTAKADRVDMIKGLESGSDDYITKPFDPELLRLRVENLIQSRYRLRELILQEFNVDAHEELKDPFLVKVNEVLATHFTNQDFNVKMMAKELHLDRTQVLRKIKDLTGLTPTDYLKQYRMIRAEEMLKKNAGNISEIAYATGYSSLSYFSFSFKEYFGVSPSEFSLQKQGE